MKEVEDHDSDVLVPFVCLAKMSQFDSRQLLLSRWDRDKLMDFGGSNFEVQRRQCSTLKLAFTYLGWTPHLVFFYLYQRH